MTQPEEPVHPSSATDTRRPRRNDGARTRRQILTAAEACLRESGYVALSTRQVADDAGVPLSQIHYHFGSKQGLVLALFEALNSRLLERQSKMFGRELPLWRQWEIACEYLDEDLASGYVRILQELTAAGWSDPAIGASVRAAVHGWTELLRGVAREATERFGNLGPLEPDDIAALVGSAFFGAEINVLAGHEHDAYPVRRALRRFGELIRTIEGRDDARETS